MKRLRSTTYMKTKSQILAGVLLATLFLTSSVFATVNSDTPPALSPLTDHTNTTRNIVDALASRHYVNTLLDDRLSEKIFVGFLDDLDPARSYFLTSDIKNFERLRFDLDNALRRGDVTPAFEIFNVYHKRVIARFAKVIGILESGIENIDFTLSEELDLDRSETNWALSNQELDDLWRKRIKNSVLSLKLAGKETVKAQELLVKRYKNRLSRSLQTNSEDVYQLYMNAFTRTYDPHTQYFSPRTSENFNINMSLSLEGIGAVLQREDEHTKVVSLVPMGPADKSEQIFPDDKIVAVGQGQEGEMVDVIGWRLDEVVQLIRGKKDTIVRLDIIPSASTDSESKVIEIKRNTVKLEEQSAKSEIIEVEQFGAIQKVGVINIPTFYIDFRALQKRDKNYKSTTRDVRNLLVDLKREGVEGIIIDLRDNGGGSLQEAKTLTGLFIDRGPTVQIRSKSHKVDILHDRDIRTIYDGPLAVLVNRLSASASEIFAGAIQDYERGVIVGNQTFGKGTVQSLLPLNSGQLKLTQAKFYRISGESTQHKGVIPDIAFPNRFDPESIGESTLDDPLPWDEIPSTIYWTKKIIQPLLADLNSLHTSRANADAEFKYMQAALAYRKVRREDKTISLNEQKRINEKEEADAFWLNLENTKRIAQGLSEIKSLDDLNDSEENLVASNDSEQIQPGASQAEEGDVGNEVVGGGEANAISLLSETGTEDAAESAEDQKEKTAQDDPYLVETSRIILDLITLEKRMAQERQASQKI